MLKNRLIYLIRYVIGVALITASGLYNFDGGRWFSRRHNMRKTSILIPSSCALTFVKLAVKCINNQKSEPTRW